MSDRRATYTQSAAYSTIVKDRQKVPAYDTGSVCTCCLAGCKASRRFIRVLCRQLPEQQARLSSGKQDLLDGAGMLRRPRLCSGVSWSLWR